MEYLYLEKMTVFLLPGTVSTIHMSEGQVATEVVTGTGSQSEEKTAAAEERMDIFESGTAEAALGYQGNCTELSETLKAMHIQVYWFDLTIVMIRFEIKLTYCMYKQGKYACTF